MSWRMPAETDPHERTWMAFPREGVTLGLRVCVVISLAAHILSVPGAGRARAGLDKRRTIPAARSPDALAMRNRLSG